MTITLKYKDGHSSEHKIIEAVEKILNSKKKIFVLEGGSGAGKTWAILMVQIILAMSDSNQRFVWMRERLTWFRTSTLKEFKKCMVKMELWDERNHNRSNFEYILNNNEIYYTGLDEKSKFLSTDWDYGWINEAIDDRITYEDFYQVSMRTKKKLFIDYNPSKIDSWIYDKVIPRDDCEFIHSTIFDNPYVPEERKRELLNTTDPILRLIYLEGKRAQAKGLIFPDVTIVESYPEQPKREIKGLDFGFTNDPSCLVRLCFNEGELWLDEMFYETGLVNIKVAGLPSIEEMLEVLGIQKHEEIIADSSEPKSITELQAVGWNIIKCDRGPGSVNAGIDAIKRYRINITQRSINGIKEHRQYCYKKIGDKVTNVPVDAFNHFWDPVRYAVRFKESRKIFTGGGGVSVIHAKR